MSIKVVDVNENIEETAKGALNSNSVRVETAKEEAIKQIEEEAPLPNEETKNEIVLNIDEETPNQNEEETKQPEALKNNSKTEKLRDKMITCPKCSKTMQLRNYRYKHEKTCRGAIENRPIKPQSRPKQKAKPKPIPPTTQEEEEVIPQFVQSRPSGTSGPSRPSGPMPVQPLQPINSLTQHYQLLQQEYIKQKQEKYNNLCKNMFATKPKKDEILILIFFSNINIK